MKTMFSLYTTPSSSPLTPLYPSRLLRLILKLLNLLRDPITQGRVRVHEGLLVDDDICGIRSRAGDARCNRRSVCFENDPVVCMLVNMDGV